METSALVPGPSVLVTGATSGIGYATALELRRRGYRVIGTARTPQKGREMLAKAAEAGFELEFVELEVTSPASCERAVDSVLSRCNGRLYALVNNAGVAFGGALRDVDDSQVRAQFEVNVFGPLRIARLALDAMRTQGGGRIVNVSSFAARFPVPFLGVYSASKRALDAVSDAMRLECAAWGIRVISVQPGIFDSQIWQRDSADISRIEDSWYADSYRRIHPKLPSSRRASPPAPVARRIAHAVQCKRPHARYLVGPHAYAAVAAERLVPRAILDLGKRWSVGLRRAKPS